MISAVNCDVIIFTIPINMLLIKGKKNFVFVYVRDSWNWISKITRNLSISASNSENHQEHIYIDIDILFQEIT